MPNCPSHHIVAPDTAAKDTTNLPAHNGDNEPSVLMITAMGTGKRVRTHEFTISRRGSPGLKGIQLVENDRLVGLLSLGLKGQRSEIMIVSNQGMITRTDWKNIPLFSRMARGVRVMNLEKGDEVQSITFL